MLLLALCLGAILPFPAFPRGAAERENRARLAQVESLIEERKYNQAILALRDLLGENPELFDAGEKLMQRIRGARSEYNLKFEELIRALFEENNIPKGLALIAELEALDPYPNEAVARALEQAKVGRELVVNMNRFNRIMDEAAALLAQGSYAEANARYLEGFALGRESFDEADYGNILKNSVLGSLQAVQQAVSDLPAALDGLQAAGSALQAALQSRDPRALDGAVGALAASARAMGGMQVAIREAGQNFQAQGRQIGDRGAGRGYDSFLFFGAQLMLGRASRPPEGLVVVFGQARAAGVAPRKQALLEAAEALWQEGLREYEAGSTPPQRLQDSAALYGQALRVIALWPLGFSPASLLGLEAPAAAEARQAGAEYLFARERIRAARGYAQLAAVGLTLAAQERGGLPAPERVGPARQQIAGLRQQAAGVEQEAAASAQALQSEGQAAGIPAPTAAGEALALKAAAAAVRERAETLDLRLLTLLSDEALGRLAAAATNYRTRFAEGQTLQQGLQTAERLEKYPDRALAVYNRLGAELAASAGEAGRLAEELARETAYLEAFPALKEKAQQLNGVREGLAGLETELAAAATGAQAESLQAGRYRQEGQLRVQEVRRYLGADPLRETSARESLQNAQEAYDRSLGFQEDAEVRRQRDQILPQLAEEINAAVNRRVIREVRELINNGRKLYSLGDYNSAEQVFLRAGARWADTHPEANPEVALWLDWTRSAIQNIAGREIALSNPLYPQMSQLYNLAHQEYERGRQLVGQGRRQEAIPLFNKAVERLDQIKILFPYNSEAQTLILRIEQLRDPDRFREVLDGQFRDALSKRELNPSEALNILEVMKVLSPSYPGLAAAIGALRIRLGLDLPPPDPAKRAEARRLYGEALRTFQQNQRELFPRALDQLNAAIALDPDYREAVELKDRLQIALGGSRQPFLSSDDQRRFKEAEGFFLDGQYASAYQIVVDLLKNRRNQGYAPLLELRAKIEARL